MTKSYVTLIEEAPDGSGDGILTFPDEMIAELGWKEGQRLQFSVNEEGNITLKAVPYENVSSEQQKT
jgi:bifunctional DNA-binding transcriptional regulator/antitoxin component of YhaV-PrlF toxin-antitoxin module